MKNLLHKNPRLIEDINFDRVKPERDIEYRWSRPGPTYKPTDGIFPDKRAGRIAKKYIGKQFSKAYSEFCSQVPKYQQKVFLDLFRPFRWHRQAYRVDKNGNIQPTKEENKYKGPYYWTSPDYRTELRHKVTGEPWDPYAPSIPWWKHHSKGNKKLQNRDDFEHVVVSGYFLAFKSQNDPRYLKLLAEDRKAQRKRDRELRKAKSEKVYSFLTQEEKERKLLKNENTNNIN